LALVKLTGLPNCSSSLLLLDLATTFWKFTFANRLALLAAQLSGKTGQADRNAEL